MSIVDLVLFNGTIYTMDRHRPKTSAVAIAGNRISAVGDDNLRDTLTANGQAIDLQGKTVIPGLIDAHLHFVSYGLGLTAVELEGVTTLKEAQRRIAERVSATKPGDWIRRGRWNCNLWADGAFPTRYDLDRVAPNHPVMLPSKDGHSIWVNSKAIELAGVTAETPDPPGGRLFRNESGEPTGIFQENAIELIHQVVPPPSKQERVEACRKAMANAARLGLTGVHNCEGALEFAAFQELEGELTLRVLMHIPSGNLDAAIAVGLQDGFGNDWLRLHGIKAFADGALGSRSAWMLEPYENDPDNVGVPTLTPEETIDLVRRANDAGLSVAIHAIGDAANRMVLNAIEQEGTGDMLRNRIEHVQLLHPGDVSRLADLKVIASMQPIHATSDIDIADKHWGKRAATSYAWRSLLDAGVALAFGSDAPVEDISPLRGIYAAVTRCRPDGSPDPEGWYPEQRVTVTQAAYAYTMGAAYAGGEEAIKGSLTPGKLADLVILDKNIFTVDPFEILNTRILATLVDGKFVYGEGNCS
jgi:predicted amidohydrolase YtcJ